MKNQTSPNVALIPLDEKGAPLVTANMKAACIGELKIQRELTCPECDVDDPDPDCEICHGERDYTESEPLDWNLMKEAYKMMAKAAIAENPQYSLDHDVLGIRTAVSNVITGALNLGCIEGMRPPAGHWAEPFYEMGASTSNIANEIARLGGFNAGLVEENNRLRQERDALKAVNAQLLEDVANATGNEWHTWRHGDELEVLGSCALLEKGQIVKVMALHLSDCDVILQGMPLAQFPHARFRFAQRAEKR